MAAGVTTHAEPVAPGASAFGEVRPLLVLAAPVVAAEIGWMAMWLVDTMIVGRLSAEAIGAVSVGGGIFFAVAIFGMGVLLGLDFLVGHAHGAGRMGEAHAGLVAGVHASLVATVVLTGVSAAIVALLPHTGIQPAIVGDAAGYLVASTASLLPLLLFATLRRYLQAQNLTAPIMTAILLANVVNAVAVWALVFGRFGAPALGAVGAGWATAAARVFLFLALLGYVVTRERRHPTGLAQVSFRPDPALLGRLVRLGVPAALQMTLEVGVFTVATLLASTLDPTSLAAHQLALNAAALSFMVPLGVASAGAVRVAQALGRHDPTRAARAGWSALGVAAAFMSAAALAFLLAPAAIMRAFTTDAAVVATGAALLAVAAAFQLFDGIQVVATGVLRGTGDTRTPMLVNLVGHWALGLPVGWLLGFRLGWGVVGIWLGLTLGLVAVATTLLAVWARRATALPAR